MKRMAFESVSRDFLTLCEERWIFETRKISENLYDACLYRPGSMQREIAVYGSRTKKESKKEVLKIFYDKLEPDARVNSRGRKVLFPSENLCDRCRLYDNVYCEEYYD